MNGNTLEYSNQNSVTSYTYDAANQLVTATNTEAEWHYEYDQNGSLVEVLPNGNASTGAKRYTYNTAGYLVEVESHNGTNWDTQAEMYYNGIGQRLEMTAYALGQSATTNYVLDPQYNAPLTATSDGNETTFLYGLGPIAEKMETWNYILSDVSNTPRQLVDMQGDITLSTRYNPWGETMELNGQGNFAFGYFGGLMDTATGLMYIGNGQYYDPSTGRFLTRNVNPNSPNPYIPNNNPIGFLLGSLSFIAVIPQGKDKKHSKLRCYLFLIVLAVFLGACTESCWDTIDMVIEAVTAPFRPHPSSNAGNANGTLTPSPTAPVEVPTNTPCTNCSTPMPSPLPTATPTIEAVPDQMDDGEWGPKSTKLYNLYLRMHREKEDTYGNKTLWWRIYGSDGKFTLVDFTAMIFIREVSTAPGLADINMNDYAEAMGRHAYKWCKDFSGYGCDSTTNKGTIYYLVDWSQIADDIAEQCGSIAETCNLSNYFQSIYGSDTEYWALKIANGIHTPEGSWMTFDKNALWDAGNVHPLVLKPHKVEDMHTDLGHEAHYESPDGKFFLVTFCEGVFLRDEMSLYNSWGCNLLPN